ncbi:MAG: CPBP family glutamic-type intramembrane protease [Acidobacteriota bacterium]
MNHLHYYENILENMDNGVMVIETGGTISMLNPAAERILGVDRAKVLGRSFANTMFMASPKNESFADAILDAVARGQVGRTTTIPYSKPEGDVVHLYVTSSYLNPVGDEPGSGKGVVVVFCDITPVKKLEETQRKLNAEIVTRSTFGRLYVVTIILFMILTLIPDTRPFPRHVRMLISWATLFTVLIPVGYFVRKTRVPLAALGLTTRNWRRSIVESVVLAAILIPLLIATHLLLTPDQGPLRLWPNMTDYSRADFILYFGLYVVHSFSQELIARGVLQGALQQFLSDYHWSVPIFIVSVIFGIAHIHISGSSAAVIFLASLLFGYVFRRQGNLIGVTIIHYALGAAASAFGYV